MEYEVTIYNKRSLAQGVSKAIRKISKSKYIVFYGNPIIFYGKTENRF